MKIGIFGGSFNPPHKMHKTIALTLIKKHYVDKVIFVPTGSKYKYKNNLLSDKVRLEMLELMCHDNNNLEVSGVIDENTFIVLCNLYNKAYQTYFINNHNLKIKEVLGV